MLREISTNNKITFLIASRYKVFPEKIRNKDYIFALDVPELSFSERKGLLKRLINIEGIGISSDDFTIFARLQDGLPNQVKFTCDLIDDYGIEKAKNNTYQIKKYNSDKTAIVLSRYSERQNVLDFLYLLSEFEYISFHFLYSMVPEDEYQPIVDEFIASSICDYVGIEKEFIHLNDMIRDFVRRNRIELPPSFKEKLDDHLTKFLNDKRIEDRDISDLTYSIRQSIKSGRTTSRQYLIPSHYLSSMREIYQERGNLDRVIELAYMLLEKEHLLEPTVASDVRYYLCLSLARKRDKRLLKEVQLIRGSEHNFLLGFYYRLQGRARDAIDRLNQCLDDPLVSSRAKRELVQVYLLVEDYDSAISLARANYDENRRNAFHVQAYFYTIVNSRQAKKQRDTLLQLIKELEFIGSEVADEMAMIARAEFLAKCEGDYLSALEQLEATANKYPDSHYPHLAKGNFAARNNDLKNLKEAYDKLVDISRDRTFHENMLVRLQAYIYCLKGDLHKAISYVEKDLRGFPDTAKASFIERLKNMVPSQ
jgi:tetratricopeptide (TPR) repeat protein